MQDFDPADETPETPDTPQAPTPEPAEPDAGTDDPEFPLGLPEGLEESEARALHEADRSDNTINVGNPAAAIEFATANDLTVRICDKHGTQHWPPPPRAEAPESDEPPSAQAAPRTKAGATVDQPKTPAPPQTPTPPPTQRPSAPARSRGKAPAG